MKKKLVVVLLTAAMSMSLLAGCGGNSGSSDCHYDLDLFLAFLY